MACNAVHMIVGYITCWQASFLFVEDKRTSQLIFYFLDEISTRMYTQVVYCEFRKSEQYFFLPFLDNLGGNSTSRNKQPKEERNLTK